MVVAAEDDVALSAGAFQARYTECLRFTEALLHSHDSAVHLGSSRHIAAMEQQYFGLTLCSALACEGRERRIRPEGRQQREAGYRAMGFEASPVRPSLVAAIEDMLQCYSPNFSVVDHGSSLSLAWKAVGLFDASAWVLPLEWS